MSLMISRKITVQITVLLTDKLKDYFHRRKDDKDNGMVVAEVGLPSGFAGDISKTRATGLEHKEATPDAVILYFKNVR